MKTYKVKQLVKPVHFIPGYPVGLPTDSFCDVAEVKKYRGQQPRYRVVNSHGSSFWVNHDDIKPVGA